MARARPRALIVSACRWAATAKMAVVLREVGFEVAFVAPPDHPLDLAKLEVDARMLLSGIHPSRSLRRAVAVYEPDIIIPVDDTIVALLHGLYRRAPELRALIARSMGAPESHAVVASRPALMEVAAECGVAVPRTARVRSEQELEHWIASHGLPAFIKRDGTWGGAGVTRVATIDEARRAYRHLRAYLTLPRLLWRALARRDLTGFALRRASSEISIQSEVRGIPANCAVAAWEGEMLACVAAAALETRGPTGASTVIRLVQNEAMQEACRRLVKRLRLSGFIGFDFMLENDTGRAVLIELNGRTTQTCHLRIGAGADPPEALRAAVTGEAARATPRTIEGDRVVLSAAALIGHSSEVR